MELANYQTEFAEVRSHIDQSRLAGGAMAAHSILAGIGLKELHKRYGVARGRPSADADPAPKWDDLCREFAGVGKDQAARLMELGDRFKKQQREKLPQLLAADGDLAPESKDEMIAMIAAQVDGQSLNALFREFGIIKAPKAAPKDRNTGGAGKSAAADKPEITDESLASDLVRAAFAPVMNLSGSPEWAQALAALPRFAGQSDALTLESLRIYVGELGTDISRAIKGLPVRPQSGDAPTHQSAGAIIDVEAEDVSTDPSGDPSGDATESAQFPDATADALDEIEDDSEAYGEDEEEDEASIIEAEIAEWGDDEEEEAAA